MREGGDEDTELLRSKEDEMDFYERLA